MPNSFKIVRKNSAWIVIDNTYVESFMNIRNVRVLTGFVIYMDFCVISVTLREIKRFWAEIKLWTNICEVHEITIFNDELIVWTKRVNEFMLLFSWVKQSLDSVQNLKVSPNLTKLFLHRHVCTYEGQFL